jgi:hypothetical protein
MLAEIYFKKNDNRSAEQELNEFLRLHPDSAEAKRVRDLLDRLHRKAP